VGKKLATSKTGRGWRAIIKVKRKMVERQDKGVTMDGRHRSVDREHIARVL
jgi:hypothetical protein